MADRSVRILGVAEVQRQLRKYGRAANGALASGLYQEGEKIMSTSKTEVPVRDGILRSTGHTDPPKEEHGIVLVELGYGGPAAPYAPAQHERLDYRHTVGKARYLADPADAAAPHIPRNVARHIGREMERA